MSSSLRSWVEDLPWMMQGVLFSAIRNCDGPRDQDPCKKIVRAIRAMVIKSAHTEGSFLAKHPTPEQLAEAMEVVIDRHGDYPVHFYMHLLHAAEIIGYMCPTSISEETSGVVWEEFYEEAVKALHMHPETAEELLERLSDDPRVHENEQGFNEMPDRVDIKEKNPC